MVQQFEYLHSVGSTSDHLKQFVDDAIPRAVVAGEQTAGRGRFGRNWHSPEGQGLYVSYLLYPGWALSRANFLNIIPALSVSAAIRKLGGSRLAVKLKPPNDVLVGDRKVSGILAELGSLNDRITWTIIGIGVNLYQKMFPEDLLEKATSLALQGVWVEHPLDCYAALTEEMKNRFERAERGDWQGLEEEYQHEHF